MCALTAVMKSLHVYSTVRLGLRFRDGKLAQCRGVYLGNISYFAVVVVVCVSGTCICFCVYLFLGVCSPTEGSS